MATTFVDYTGDGNATKSFSFPSIKEADIKVEVDEVLKTSGNHYNITSYTTTGGGNVVFTSGNIPVSPAQIRIFRDTDVDSAKATFTAGSSVKAGDLNDNQTQVLYAAQEEQNQTIQTHKIKDGAVTTAKIKDGAVTTAKLAADSVTGVKIADDSIDSEHYVDGSIDTAHIGNSQVTTVKLANNAVTTGKLADDCIDQSKIADNAVLANHILDGNITASKIAANAVQNAKLGPDCVTGAKIADDSVDSEHIVADSLDTEHYAPTSIDTAALASNAVTTDKITDANVTSLKIADNAITIGKIGCEQTTLSDSDSHIPTSGAVVDYVAAQLAPLGGFEAIANEQSFPNTQPASGVVISIADVGGLAVSNSGTASGQTVGGTTVNITGIASNFNGTTVAAGVRFLVASTGSGQNYTYHKATLKEDDLVNLSGDINDFSERYRVGSQNPTSSLDNGDLFFNTSTGKMLVYNGTNTAWEEVQSIGNFFISTLSPAFDNTTQNFTITNAPTNVQQILLVINGVVQKPNAGTSTPAEGFALDGSTIKLAAAPATGSTYHAVVMGSTVNIGTPSDGTVTAAKLTSGSVIEAKIATGAVTTTKIANDAVTTTKIADDAITAAKIADNAVTTALIADGTITNANISNTAAIDASKIANLATDSITEGNSKAEVIGSGTNNGEFKVVVQDATSNGAAAESLRQYRSGNYNITELNSGNSTASSKLEFNFLQTAGDIVFSKDAGGNSPSSATIRSNGGGTGGNFEFYPVDGNVRFNITGDGTFTQGTIYPWQDSTHDIGTNTNRWANVYADTYYGAGSNITGLNAANLSSGTIPDARFPATLPAVSGANLTNLPAGGKTKNIMINGAMNVAQRGTTSTDSSGYHVCDRWDQSHGSTDEAPTFSQEDVTAGGAYDAGFSKCLRITNGNQTSGAGADDLITVGYAFESQDIQNSGWQFKNSSSKVTLSFWIKSSVSQEFFGQFLVPTGTAQNFPFGTGVLQANTWTKITKTIPGNSNLGIPNTYNQGARIYIWAFAGTNLTGNVTNDAWQANNYSTRVSDNTTTWYTTNDATLEITGFQLETGDTASDFVFETYGETLQKCKRYCHVIAKNAYSYLGLGMQYYSGTIYIDGGQIDMRDTPAMVAKSLGSGQYVYEKVFGNSPEYIHQISLDSKTTKDHVFFSMAGTANRHGQAVRCACHAFTLQNGEPFVYLESEL